MAMKTGKSMKSVKTTKSMKTMESMKSKKTMKKMKAMTSMKTRKSMKSKKSMKSMKAGRNMKGKPIPVLYSGWGIIIDDLLDVIRGSDKLKRLCKAAAARKGMSWLYKDLVVQ